MRFGSQLRSCWICSFVFLTVAGEIIFQKFMVFAGFFVLGIYLIKRVVIKSLHLSL